jgi:hypothetical protein
LHLQADTAVALLLALCFVRQFEASPRVVSAGADTTAVSFPLSAISRKRMVNSLAEPAFGLTAES